jgi:hypothetical protein
VPVFRKESVGALLEIRPAAIAEAQRLSPELLRAELVRLDDAWADVLTRSRAHAEQQLLQRAAEFRRRHQDGNLLIGVDEPLRAEIVHSSA